MYDFPSSPNCIPVMKLFKSETCEYPPCEDGCVRLCSLCTTQRCPATMTSRGGNLDPHPLPWPVPWADVLCQREMTPFSQNFLWPTSQQELHLSRTSIFYFILLMQNGTEPWALQCTVAQTLLILPPMQWMTYTSAPGPPLQVKASSLLV